MRLNSPPLTGCVSRCVSLYAVKEAAVQRRHNLYRDSMVLTNSDPNLHLLGESPSVDWAAKFSSSAEQDEEEGGAQGEGPRGGLLSAKRRRQVVSMIQLDGLPLAYESCMEVPGVEQIPEEDGEDPALRRKLGLGEEEEEDEEGLPGTPRTPKSPDSVHEIRGLINPVLEVDLPEVEARATEEATDGTELASGTVVMEDGVVEEVKQVTTLVERGGDPGTASSQDMMKRLMGNSRKKEVAAIEQAIQEIEIAVQEGAKDTELDAESAQTSLKTNEGSGEVVPQPIRNGLKGGDGNAEKLENIGEKVAVHISDVVCEV
ncbi:hypothetical protein CRUP_038620 [Coryphaenoides rupestris]|nr:hypothetical protein CRUP_038620 [Coryphaenoides rupestris]